MKALLTGCALASVILTDVGARQMECREWVDKQYRGIYTFNFDPAKKTLTLQTKPEGDSYLFGRSVPEWKFMHQDENRVAFYGIDADWAMPVQVVSLHFDKATMYTYGIGIIEGDRVISSTERRCRRLD